MTKKAVILLVMVNLFFIVCAFGVYFWTKLQKNSSLKDQTDILRLENGYLAEEKDKFLNNINNNEYYSTQIKSKLVLKDGLYYKEPDTAKTSFGVLFSIEKFADGDLDGDGKNDAAVILKSFNEGSNIPVYDLNILNGQDYGLAWMDSKDFPYGTQIKSIGIQDGVAVVDAVIPGPDEIPCCPTSEKIFRYKLIDRQISDLSGSSDSKTRFPDSEKGKENPNWVKYSDSDLGFWVEYPEIWGTPQKSELDTKIEIKFYDKLYIAVNRYYSDNANYNKGLARAMTLEEYADINKNNKDFEQKKTEIDGRKAIKNIYTNGADGKKIAEMFIANNNNIILIRGDADLFDRIISTFKFLDSKSAKCARYFNETECANAGGKILLQYGIWYCSCAENKNCKNCLRGSRLDQHRSE